jgi:hypothetical protein
VVWLSPGFGLAGNKNALSNERASTKNHNYSKPQLFFIAWLKYY